MVILNLSSHDIIIGYIWLAYFNIAVDARNRRLFWPKEIKPSYSAVKEIVAKRTELQHRIIPCKDYQADIKARNAAFEKEDQRLFDGK